MTETAERWHRSLRSHDLSGLGHTEAQVMRVLWDLREATVRDVYEELRPRRRIALTTVTTTLSNLAAKGLARQERSSRAFVYTPALEDAEVAARIVDEVVDVILGGDPSSVVEHLRRRQQARGQEPAGAPALRRVTG